MGTSLVVQWLRLQASTAGCTGSIPGWAQYYEVTREKQRKHNEVLKIKMIINEKTTHTGSSNTGLCAHR